ncbi:signal recognition particle subunit SEC65 [Methanococcus voltae]|uniref:signal recognition particle subunit SRP19/SEC65 family protein n=1 Tax=Methanococcus voltae TaxID=2188 RepID=UPI001AE668C9|nr:signal recognition particle subunit SRP19/SEC65 family protein [Methanococcus voltae]MBP2142875.1 signal recognition particle subunit SEC65 [Methanococcus voltae]
MTQKEFVIWPAYFDIQNSRSKGRKLNKEFCTRNVKLKDLVSAAKKLGYSYEQVNSKAYPKEPWENIGYLKIKIKNEENSESSGKYEILLKIGKQLLA